jgi:hypothetical protein
MDVHFYLEALEEAINVQRFLNIHAAVYNLFNLGRHLVSAEAYRFFRLRSFACWRFVSHRYDDRHCRRNRATNDQHSYR